MEKTIIEFFDVQNEDHLKAYKRLCAYGAWPANFISDGIVFPNGWASILSSKIADAWICLKLEGNPTPTFAKKISKEWEWAFHEYFALCGLEPMHQEDIDSGKITPRDAWVASIEMLENICAEVCNIKTPSNGEDL